jgi:Glycosyl hydrolases family 16
MTLKRLAATLALTVALLAGCAVAGLVARHPRSGSHTTTLTTGAQPLGDPLGKKWTLTFDDEFNERAIDMSRWVAINGRFGNNEYLSSADCSERGGDLVLSLPGNGTGCQIDSAPYAGAPDGYVLPVGGYVEARIWFPGPGSSPTSTVYNWPAFWASGPKWPAAGEIDIAEGIGPSLTINYHSLSRSVLTNAPPGDWANSWHVYGVYRGPSSDRVYYDGALVRTIRTSDNRRGEGILFTSGGTGGCCGGPSMTGPVANVLVDWVRAWQ